MVTQNELVALIYAFREPERWNVLLKLSNLDCASLAEIPLTTVDQVPVDASIYSDLFVTWMPSSNARRTISSELSSSCVRFREEATAAPASNPVQIPRMVGCAETSNADG